MSRLELRQNLKQKLSPQQIQFMKLLQVSNANIESEIKKELEENPALEEIENNEKKQLKTLKNTLIKHLKKQIEILMIFLENQIFQIKNLSEKI